MVNSYRLVNPHIEGNFKSLVKAQNSQKAAENFYKDISSHFNNSVREFNFSIQKGSSGSGKMFHFKVKEHRKKNEVDYSIIPLKIRGEEEHVSKFKEKLNNFKQKFDSQEGGKKKTKKSKSKSKDSSSSDSDSDSDSELTEQYYKRAKKYIANNQPIYYWWYDPYLYNLSTLYLPTFYSYVTPYIELSLSY
jgi:hypothetical protein